MVPPPGPKDWEAEAKFWHEQAVTLAETVIATEDARAQAIAERDRARAIAVGLEQGNARLEERIDRALTVLDVEIGRRFLARELLAANEPTP